MSVTELVSTSPKFDCNCPCCREGIDAPHEYHLESRRIKPAAHTDYAPLGFTSGEKSAWSIGYEEGWNAAINSRKGSQS